MTASRNRPLSSHFSLFFSRNYQSKAAFAIMAVICLLASRVEAKYSGGTGEPNNPYRIATPNDLNDIGNHPEDWSSHFVMVNDINLADYNGTKFNMIGEKTPDAGTPFTGVFDGNRHMITNFNYTGSEEYPTGLFEYVGPSGEIGDLALQDVNVTNDYLGSTVGALVGYNRGTVRQCFVAGIVSGNHLVGGLMGYNYYGVISYSFMSGTVSGADDFTGGLTGANLGIISSCCATGSVFGGNYTGGLVGENYHGMISDCFSSGNVSGRGYDAAGLVGVNVDGTISNCYATSVVSGNHRVGGLVGYNVDSTISNCYAVAAIDGNDNIGGLVAYHESGSYTKCFWDSDVNPDVNGIGNGTDPNVTGKTTDKMQKESTFTDAGWDFVEIWNIGENQTYPFLRVYPAGDLNHDGRVDLFDFGILAGHWLEGVE